MLPVKRAEWCGGISQNFTVLQDVLYLCSMPKGENEDLLLFIVPKAHWTATLNECHQDAGHQGCDRTLSLLQEHFWWPRMAKQMRQTIRACTCCLQYEGGFPKAPLCPIVATAPLDLLHVDFTSIETTCRSQTNHLESPMSWCSKTTSWNTCWHMWPLIKLQKPSPNFYMGITSLSLGPWPGSWAIEVLASWVACNWGNVQDPWHQMTVDHTLPPPN